MTNIYCKGIQCSVKNRCLRYTSRIGGALNTIGGYTEIRKCTNQNKFVQDINSVKKGG
jgi:hypothetical protein